MLFFSSVFLSVANNLQLRSKACSSGKVGNYNPKLVDTNEIAESNEVERLKIAKRKVILKTIGMVFNEDK